MLTRTRPRRAGRLRRAPREHKEKTLTRKWATWVCANVYLETDRYSNLVTCAVVCDSLEEARKVAREKAEGLLEVYNADEKRRGNPTLTFEQAWSAVDHDDGIEHEYGYDPIYANVSYAAIRVFKAETVER